MADQEDSPADRGRVSPAVALALVLVVGAVGGVAFAQSTADGPSGETVLENAHNQYRSAETLTGSASVTVSNATDERSATVEYALADEGARMSVTYNDTTMTAGTNGSVAWVSAPEAGVQRAWNVENASSWDVNQVCEAVQNEVSGFDLSNRTDIPDDVNASAMQANVSAIRENVSSVDCESLPTEWADTNGSAMENAPANWSDTNLTTTRTGTETLDGTEAYVVAIEHENDSIDANGTVWVATEDSRVLKQRVSDGTNATTVRYDDQRFNVSIDESTFQPPADRVTAWSFDRYDSFAAAQDATDLDLPSLDGGTFAEATVTVQQGETVVSQRYELDGENVTVVSTTSERFRGESENASTVQIDGRNASVTDFGDRSAVFWTEDDVITVVIVDGSTDRAVEVAERVDV